MAYLLHSIPRFIHMLLYVTNGWLPVWGKSQHVRPLSIVSFKCKHVLYITNCTFSNNTGRSQVSHHNFSRHILILSTIFYCDNLFHYISDNNMTGIYSNFGTNARFIGRNVIQNNRNTEGAGIILATCMPTLKLMVNCFCTTTLLINMVEQFLYGTTISCLHHLTIIKCIPCCTLHFLTILAQFSDFLRKQSRERRKWYVWSYTNGLWIMYGSYVSNM